MAMHCALSNLKYVSVISEPGTTVRTCIGTLVLLSVVLAVAVATPGLIVSTTTGCGAGAGGWLLVVGGRFVGLAFVEVATTTGNELDASGFATVDVEEPANDDVSVDCSVAVRLLLFTVVDASVAAVLVAAATIAVLVALGSLLPDPPSDGAAAGVCVVPAAVVVVATFVAGAV